MRAHKSVTTGDSWCNQESILALADRTVAEACEVTGHWYLSIHSYKTEYLLVWPKCCVIKIADKNYGSLLQTSQI